MTAVIIHNEANRQDCPRTGRKRQDSCPKNDEFDTKERILIGFYQTMGWLSIIDVCLTGLMLLAQPDLRCSFVRKDTTRTRQRSA